MQTKTTKTRDILPEDVRQHCAEFTSSLSSVDQLLRPLIKHQESMNVKELSPIDRAKLNLCCAYTVNTLFYMYLKTQGIDPNEHPVREELKRVQEYMGKLRERSMKQTSTTTQQQEARPVVTVNKENAHKFFTHALKKQQNSATEDAAAPEDRKKQQQNTDKKKKKRETSNDKTGESPKKRRKNK